MSYGDFRTPDGLGPSYQALGNLVPNMLKSYTGGLGIFRDNERRTALAGLGPNATPQDIAAAMFRIGDAETGLGAIRLGEMQADRGLAREKMNLEIAALNRAQNESAETGAMLRGLFGGGVPQQAPARPASAGGARPVLASSSLSGEAAMFPTPEEGRGLISYKYNDKTIRNRPVAPELATNLERAVAEVYGPGYKVQIYSGGQAGVESSGPRVGSTRHDHGNAADVYIVGPDGQRVTGDRLAPLAQYWQARGIGGTGLEMRGGGIHLDVHSDRPSAWNYQSQGGRFTPAQAQAIQAGQAARAAGVPMANRSFANYAGLQPNEQPQPANFQQPAAPVQMAQAATGQTSDAAGLQAAPTQALQALRMRPGLNPGAASLIDAELKRREAMSAPTEAQRNFEAARRGGFQGSFMDYQQKMREKEIVSGESEENKATGKGAGEAQVKMYEAAGSAPGSLARLNRLSGMIDQVATGKLAPGRMSMAQWGRAFGVDDGVLKSIGLDPREAATGEAVQSLLSQMVVGSIGAGGFPANNFSDKDREFLVGMMPQLSNDPRANSIIIEGMRRVEQSKIDKAKSFREWKAANPKSSYFDFETEWSSKQAETNKFDDLRQRADALVGGGNPQMPPGNKVGPKGGSAAAKISNEAEYARLPAGSQYIAPDGTVRTKR